MGKLRVGDGKRPEEVYRGRIEAIEVKIKTLNKKDIPLAVVKLMLLVVGLIFLYLFITRPDHLYWPHFSLTVLLFIAAALIHERILKQKRHQQDLRLINENEIKSLHHQFLDVDWGEAFVDTGHPFTADLDIFGEHSLFHYVNRTTTHWGREALARWLSSHWPVETIRERQQAISELKDNIDFRQNIQATGGLLRQARQRQNFIEELLALPSIVLNRKWLTAAIFVLPPLTLAAVFLMLFGWPWPLPFGLFLLQSLLNGVKDKKVSQLCRLTGKTAKILSAHASIIDEIRRQDFSSACLKENRRALEAGKEDASRLIRRLSTLLEWLDLRQSAIHFLVNNIVCWDLHLVRKIEAWKRQTGGAVARWLAAVGRVEALASLANLYFNHPRWVIPEMSGSPFRLEAKAMGHPLILEEERVDSDFTVQGAGKISIVTGPNMAGKSTFLRAVGVNIVLALTGAPVCARRFSLSPCQLYTSMKISDSLDKGLSLFYAELQRLKMILEAIARTEPVFFVIDEMLKGTNTLDRQQGAVAMIRQFIRQQTGGLLATHDLALSKMAEEHPDNVVNHHFDGEIRDDQLIFDYKLRKGPCRSSNALTLMRKIGIEV